MSKADGKHNDDKGTIRVLVYGSLKDGHVNNDILKGCRAKFMGYDCITGRFKMISLGPFPAVIEDPKREVQDIYGEVYSMNEETLAHLDFLEGHPNFFERNKVWTTHSRKRVWVYMLAGLKFDSDKEVPDGLWQPSSDEELFWGNKEEQSGL
jgi:gamma-glutamylaminecyclotransferase